MKIHRAWLIGLGGTGSILAEPLVRLLAHHPQGTRDMTFVDGDVYEEKNAVRQLFAQAMTGQNKAVAAAQRLDFLQIRTIPNFVDPQFLMDELTEARTRALEETPDQTTDPWTPLIVCAVDNAATRVALINVLENLGWGRFILVDPGNELDYGSVYTYAKIDGVKLTCNPIDIFENMREVKDEIPGGCAAKTPSSPQLIVANMGAAYCTLMTINAILDDREWFDSLNFHCRKATVVPQGQPVAVKKILEEAAAAAPAEAPSAQTARA